jgi:hypothetical protein
MRRRNLDDTTFFMFHKTVIVKKENNSAKICLRKKYYIQVGVLQRLGFLSKALRLTKKLDLQRTPLKKVSPN